MWLNQSQNPKETSDVMFVGGGWWRGLLVYCVV
jgi:hypothetical protein